MHWIIAKKLVRRNSRMINIAICDDDKAFTGIVERLLRQIAAEQGVEVNCEVFFDGSAIVKAVMEQQMCFDLIYLDIEMEFMDGIRAALALREAEIPALLVYVSVHEEHLKELFYTEPFRFLSKPIDEAAFLEVFLSARERIRQRTGYFTFSYKKTLYRIPFDQITYFESCRRIITIHLPRSDTDASNLRQTCFYAKMNDIEKQVASLNGRFLRVHQSFLVNFGCIKAMSATEIEMLDGKIIQISEDRKKSAMTRFMALAGVKGDKNERIVIS